MYNQRLNNISHSIVTGLYCMLGMKLSYINTLIFLLLCFRKLRSFRFTATNPGEVFLREKTDSPEQCLRILQVNADVFEDSFPDVIQAGGISRARQEYLFKKIRPFVREEHKNELCPPLEE